MNINTGKQIHRRFALLIGVNEYEDTHLHSLTHTMHDVVDLENLLTQFGYEVRTLHCHKPDPRSKPTKKNICFELEQIHNKFNHGDLLLVHFGGHVKLDKVKAYLLASDSDSSRLEESAINLEEFKKKIAATLAQVKILFLDACHCGIERGVVGVSSEFEDHVFFKTAGTDTLAVCHSYVGQDPAAVSLELEDNVFLEAEGMATLASCMRHEISYNHDMTSNGLFTHYLLEGLKGKAAQKYKRFITFYDLKIYVTDKVKTWAKAKMKHQTPNSITQLVGDPPLVELEIKLNQKKILTKQEAKENKT